MASTLRQRATIDVDLTTKSSRTGTLSSASSDSDSGVDFTDLDEQLKPFTPPSFTIGELLNAIPKHCYERSFWKSFSYVVFDFALYGALLYAATFIDPSFGKDGAILNGNAGVAAKWATWSVWWTFTSWNFVGIWILAHECGHQAFSTSKTVNDAFGLFMHSFVLVPYHSWRISHSKHHAATGHMTRDEVFVPAQHSYAQAKYPKKNGKKIEHNGIELHELLEDAPAYRLFWLLVQQLLGWPAYLFANASGQDFYPAWTNHFDPKSLIFDARHRTDILVSDAALLVMGAALTAVVKHWDFATLVKYYGIPYIGVNHWLVMITYLQHTDPNLPHYYASEWNFARGALCTIDRNFFGFVGPYLTHGICETHISHHLNSRIPHYHAWEATDALKAYLGEYYTVNTENMFVSLWNNWRMCRFVDDAATSSVVFYRDAYGRANRNVVMKDPASDSGVDVEAKEL